MHIHKAETGRCILCWTLTCCHVRVQCVSAVALKISNWITTVWQAWRDCTAVLDPHNKDGLSIRIDRTHTHVNMFVRVAACVLDLSLQTSGCYSQGQAKWLFMHTGAKSWRNSNSVNAEVVCASRGIFTLKLKLLITVVKQQSLLKYMTICLFNYIHVHIPRHCREQWDENQRSGHAAKNFICSTVLCVYIKRPFSNTKQSVKQKCYLCCFDPRMNVMSSALRFNNTSRHVLQAHEERGSACVK